MASVTTPEATDVIRLCGLSRYVTGESQGDFEDRIDLFIADAEMLVALQVGESSYDGSTWTARQAGGLETAVCYKAGSLFLLDPEIRKLLGTQEPLLMEDSDDIDAAADRLDGRASELISRVTAGVDAVPFAMPAVSSGTFTVTSSERTPSEKIDLIDERDGISSSDIDNG